MSAKSLSRRNFLRAGAFAAAGTTLAACAPQVIEKTVEVEKTVKETVQVTVKETQVVKETVVVSAKAEPITITLWHGWTGADNTEMLGKILDNYNKTNTDLITIEPTAYDWDTFFAKWVLAAASGNPADVALFHPTEVPEFAERGVIIPLDQYADSVGWSWEGIADGIKQMCYYKGKLMGIIEDIHPLGMYYNEELAKKAGLDPDKPPTTAAEYLEWAKAMTIKDASGNFTQIGAAMPTTATARWIWHAFLSQNGGKFLDADNKAAFNTPEGKESLQFMVDFFQKEKLAPVGEDDGGDFQAKKAGVYFSGPWMTNSFLKAEVPMRTAPMPACFKQPATWTNSHVLSLSKTEEATRQMAGMKFIKWFAMNNLDACVNVGVIPVTPKVMDELKAHPRWQYYESFAKQADYVAYEPLIPQYTQIFTFAKPTPLTVNLEAALTGKVTVEEALAEMEKGVNEILATPIS